MAPTKAASAPAPAEVEVDENFDFLSDEQVEDVAKDAAADSRYIKLSKLEENKVFRFRFFGKGITGYEGWVQENGKDRPVRWRTMPAELPANLKEYNGKREVKRFIAGLVWDYQSESFKVLLITQKSVLEKFTELLSDKEDHGDPRKYDIKLKRVGSGLETKYTLSGGQWKEAPQDAVATYEDTYCNLDHLFQGLDPWDPNAKPLDEEEDDD